jgi:hypothetical protein
MAFARPLEVTLDEYGKVFPYFRSPSEGEPKIEWLQDAATGKQYIDWLKRLDEHSIKGNGTRDEAKAYAVISKTIDKLLREAVAAYYDAKKENDAFRLREQRRAEAEEQRKREKR